MVQTFRTGARPGTRARRPFWPARILSWRLGFPMSVRDLAGAMCDMQPRGTPEDHQTEGPPYNATTVIAPRRETHPWRRLTFCVAASLVQYLRLAITRPLAHLRDQPPS